jgi:hypothetical protein
MFDLFVLQNTAQRRVREQFESTPARRERERHRAAKREQPRRTALVTVLRPFRAVADR